MSGSTSTAATGTFHTSNGQVIGPDGQPFVAAGIDVMEGNQPSAGTLQSDFPGINFVRLAIYDYQSPAALTAYVNDLTSAGIVVELEDHSNSNGTNAGGASGNIFTGQQLNTELSWYSSVASAFANNPYVWFGTNNEPSETDSSGNQDPAALSTWQQQTYNAVRDAGNSSPVLVEIDGGSDPSSFAQGYTSSVYTSMTNIVADVHYYGWLTGYSTDQATVSGNLAADIAQTRQVVSSANGTVPIIIGEFGNSTSGTTIDANADQVINAVQQSGAGTVAWSWGSGYPGDGLTVGSGTSLSAYGQQIAAGIAASAKSSPSAAPVTTAATTPAATPATSAPAAAPAAPTPAAANPAAPASADGSTVTAAAAGSLTDASGNAWTIVDGVAEINGAAAGYSANVSELAYAGGAIWQENTGNLWWEWTGTGWSSGAGTSASPLPANAPAAPATTPATPAAAAAPASTASANDTTVLAGSTGSILDASGNAWSITATGQVAVNGTADATTADVTELAYVNNAVWQENASNLWWDKTAPSDAWAPGPGTATSPLPAAITLDGAAAGDTVSQSQISVQSTSGNNLLFISGSGDTVNLSGGADTITDTGQGNTYILPTAGNGTDTFTSDITATGGTLDLTAALAATDWTGSASTLADYVTVADTASGAVLSVAPTSGGIGVAIATIDGATTATLSSLLPHLTT